MSVAVDTRRRLTESRLADLIDRPLGFTVGLLEELEAAGHVERVGDRWQLTARCERRFGMALRGLAGDE